MDAEKMADDILKRGDPRSLQYRMGLINILRFKVWGQKVINPRRMPECPYELGTPEADAYLSGIERGKLEWQFRHEKPSWTYIQEQNDAG